MPIILGDIKLFTLEEIYESVGITAQTMRKHIADGSVKARKLGRIGWVISERALLEFFESGNQEATTESAAAQE